jgi:CspA family cold shock protein
MQSHPKGRKEGKYGTWFSDAKGFGFIQRANGKKDAFVHHSMIQTEGYRTLAEGQAVEFEVTDSSKGLQALNVRPCPPDPDSDDGLWQKACANVTPVPDSADWNFEPKA